MSASQAFALGAVAFQFSAALQAYEEDMDSLVGAGAHAERYHRVSARMDEMRMYAESAPALSAAWVEVMIRHFELTHALLRTQQRDPEQLADLQCGWREAVQRLARKCLQLIPAA